MQVRHCAYDVGVRRARARARAPYWSIISTIGVLFLRHWGPGYFLPDRSISENYRAASGTLLVRFGFAPDALDALLLRPPKPRKNHAVLLGERLSSYERVSDALPCAPNEKRRSDDG